MKGGVQGGWLWRSLCYCKSCQVWKGEIYDDDYEKDDDDDNDDDDDDKDHDYDKDDDDDNDDYKNTDDEDIPRMGSPVLPSVSALDKKKYSGELFRPRF